MIYKLIYIISAVILIIYFWVKDKTDYKQENDKWEIYLGIYTISLLPVINTIGVLYLIKKLFSDFLDKIHKLLYK